MFWYMLGRDTACGGEGVATGSFMTGARVAGLPFPFPESRLYRLKVPQPKQPPTGDPEFKCMNLWGPLHLPTVTATPWSSR